MNKQISYLIYYYRGEIKVKAGYMDGVFCPLDNKHTWQTGVPHKPMVVNSKSKIWVKRTEDIPKAKELLKEHILNRYTETITKSADMTRLQNYLNILVS